MAEWTVGFYTLGCKVSQYETEAVAEKFLSLGFRIAPFDSVCDVYVINTCTVTAESDRKSRQIIRRAVRRNPHAVVMAMGCSVQGQAEMLKTVEGIAYLSGSHNKMLLPEKAIELLTQKNKMPRPLCEVTDIWEAPFEPMTVTTAPRTRAYVKIEDGCECRCSYCAIPNARGRVRSKSPDDVVKEVQGLFRQGTAEVVLTGIEIASYGKDLDGFRLIDLLERMEREEDIPRLRLGSLTPEVLTKGTILRLSRLKKLVPHFHLSIQSGSDEILKKMRRRYLTDRIREAVTEIRALMPSVMFTCDVMVGFPGETDEHHRETVDTLSFCRFLDMHIFVYSRRPDTPAAEMPMQVPPAVGQARSRELAKLNQTVKTELLTALVKEAKPLSVLFETEENGIWHGHSDSYVPVSVASSEDLHAQIRNVIPQSLENGIVFGILQ